MLSSQTKDATTAAAVSSLLRLEGGLTPKSLLQTPRSTIEECINKVGFWRRKTDYILEAAKEIEENFGGDIPDTLQGLVSLKGVGPKMAYLCLQSAWGVNEGIGVDTHVHRITNRLGWHVPPTKDPEKTRVNLESWLPKEYYDRINIVLVGFGQTICVPVGPKCDLCDVAAVDGLCPSRKIPAKTKKRKITKVKHEELATLQIEYPSSTSPIDTTFVKVEAKDESIEEELPTDKRRIKRLNVEKYKLNSKTEKSAPYEGRRSLEKTYDW
jgi:endonuclease III